MQRVLAVAALGTAALLLIATWSGLIIVLGTAVLPGWLLVTGPLLLSAALTVSARLQRQPTPPVRVLPRGVTIALAVFVVIGTMLTVADAVIDGADHRVLEPTGPDGCQAAVRETSFFNSGGGDVYSVAPVGIGWRTGSWRSDDGYRPIAAGTYRLTWGPDGNGLLELRGSPGDPIIGETMFQVRC